MYLISILYACEKKVKNFFYIERYVNDLHRPTLSFSWRGGKKILQIENGRWYVDTTHAQPYPSKNFCFLGKVCKRPTSTHIRPTSKKCKKARKTGRMWVHEPHIPTLRTREKKVIFFYIERYGNDQHRPTLSFFHRMAGRKVLHENRNLFAA